MTLSAFIQDVRKGLWQLFLPNTCWVCERHLPEETRSFCPPCLQAITTDPLPACPRCGSTVGPHVPLDQGCIHCRDESFAFEAVFRLGEHDGLLREVILRLKQPGSENLGEAVATLFAELLAPRLQAVRPDVIVPIPLHWLRYWRRGFNQGEILGRSLAEKLGKPCRPRVLRRVRRTPPQTSQTFAQRRQNVKGAFAARAEPSLKGKTVVLVDDVLTTGATAHEAAKALKPLGPAHIHVCVLAKSKTS